GAEEPGDDDDLDSAVGADRGEPGADRLQRPALGDGLEQEQRPEDDPQQADRDEQSLHHRGADGGPLHLPRRPGDDDDDGEADRHGVLRRPAQDDEQHPDDQDRQEGEQCQNGQVVHRTSPVAGSSAGGSISRSRLSAPGAARYWTHPARQPGWPPGAAAQPSDAASRSSASRQQVFFSATVSGSGSFACCTETRVFTGETAVTSRTARLPSSLLSRTRFGAVAVVTCQPSPSQADRSASSARWGKTSCAPRAMVLEALASKVPSGRWPGRRIPRACS